MVLIVKEMRPLTKKPLLAQSNAGIPEWVDGNAVYTETPEAAVPKVREMLAAGVNLVGGCCGTGPSHIRKIREAVPDAVDAVADCASG